MPEREITRVLIVEDGDALRSTLMRALSQRYGEVRACVDVCEAKTALEDYEPDLMILDVELPDGTAIDVMRAASTRDTIPLAIAISGAARPAQTFELAQLGVHTFLPKPIDLEQLERAIERVRTEPPDLTPHLRSQVGQRSIHEVEEEVRHTMLSEAMARAGGSKRGAARLLAISRQLIQHMLRRDQDL